MALHTPDHNTHQESEQQKEARLREIRGLQKASKSLGGDRKLNLKIQKLQNPEAFKDGHIKPGKRAKRLGKLSRQEIGESLEREFEAQGKRK